MPMWQASAHATNLSELGTRKRRCEDLYAMDMRSTAHDVALRRFDLFAFLRSLGSRMCAWTTVQLVN